MFLKKQAIFLISLSLFFFSLISILFCIFSPPFILNSLLRAIGFDYFVVDWIRIISFFIWLWFISPIDKLSKKERYEKNKRKLDLVKAIEKARETYDKNLNKTNSAATNKK